MEEVKGEGEGTTAVGVKGTVMVKSMPVVIVWKKKKSDSDTLTSGVLTVMDTEGNGVIGTDLKLTTDDGESSAVEKGKRMSAELLWEGSGVDDGNAKEEKVRKSASELVC